MADLPIVITVSDASNPNLLVRVLRTIADKIVSLGTRIDDLASNIKFPSFSQIRDQLLVTGSTPLNVTGLRGVLADAQPANAFRYSAAPTGSILQDLKDGQLITVKNGSSYDLMEVVGGNPNTLLTLISGGSVPANMVTTNTNQNITATKTFTVSQTFAAAVFGGIITANAAVNVNAALTATSLAVTNNGALGSASFSLETASTNPYTIAGTGVFVGKTVSGASTVNLPAAGGANLGQVFVIVDVLGNASTNNITVAGNGHNIDGAASVVISTNYGVLRVFWTGSVWKTW